MVHRSNTEKFIISRDEMNLAEFPLTVLSTRSNPHIKTIEFSDVVKNKNGEPINRSWVITGADKFGLPTSSDDEVLLGLMKLSVEQGFAERKVLFTRYELLKALRWTTEGRSYSRLQKALDRLSGVRIKASNAFYDNEEKRNCTRNFGIIDAYEINDGKGTPSFFLWSEVLFKSFQVGFIKKLDLSFYLDLKSSVTKRLYRYLDKHFWYKSKLKLNVFTLAHEKLGISRTHRFVSSIRQQIDPALEELKDRGFITDFYFEGAAAKTELIVVAASGARVSTKTNPEKQVEFGKDPDEGDNLKAKLVKRGLLAGQVDALLKNRPKEILERIEKIINHYDYLINSKSRLVSLSPVGFLYRAVEKPETFNLPDDEKRQTPLNLTKSPRPKLFVTNTESKGATAESRYLTLRHHRIQQLKGDMENATIKKMRLEAESAIKNLKGIISEDRFAEAVEMGLDRKIASLFSVPTFEDWLKDPSLLVLT